MESLALTVEEVMDVRRVLVKAEMEKFLQNKELFSSLKMGKVRSWVGGRCGQGWAWQVWDNTGLQPGSPHRFAAVAEPSSRCCHGHPPVSFARGEPYVHTLAVNSQGKEVGSLLLSVQ